MLQSIRLTTHNVCLQCRKRWKTESIYTAEAGEIDTRGEKWVSWSKCEQHTTPRTAPSPAAAASAQYPPQLYDGHPPHELPETSAEAARTIEPVSGSIRRRVFDFIVSCGVKGATDDEIERALGLRHQTASARRRELYLLGEIRTFPGFVRKTSSGRMAQAWIKAPHQPGKDDAIPTRNKGSAGSSFSTGIDDE